MHDGTLACSLQRRTHRATQTCQSPLRAFQAASISSDLQDLWIWKSADNMFPHITVKPVGVCVCVEGGVCFPAFISMDKHVGCQPIRCCCFTLTLWLKAEDFFRQKVSAGVIEVKVGKHKFYGLNKSNPIWPGWHFSGRLGKGQTEIWSTEGTIQAQFRGSNIWISADSHRHYLFHCVDLCRAGPAA